MIYISQILSLVKKDILLEWRQRYIIGGLILYVVSTVFVIYLSLSQQGTLQSLEQKMWNILFWITLLFASVNAVAKSFLQESRERLLYYYTLTSPQIIIFSRMIYNVLLLLLLAIICLAVFALMIGYPIVHFKTFAATILLGGSGFAFLMTLVSAIAAKASNNSTLMAILSFPLILPMILFLMKISSACLYGVPSWDDVKKDMLLLAAVDVLVVSLSYLLFPYLWKE